MPSPSASTDDCTPPQAASRVGYSSKPCDIVCVPCHVVRHSFTDPAQGDAHPGGGRQCPLDDWMHSQTDWTAWWSLATELPPSAWSPQPAPQHCRSTHLCRALVGRGEGLERNRTKPFPHCGRREGDRIGGGKETKGHARNSVSLDLWTPASLFHNACM